MNLRKGRSWLEIRICFLYMKPTLLLHFEGNDKNLVT